MILLSNPYSVAFARANVYIAHGGALCAMALALGLCGCAAGKRTASAPMPAPKPERMNWVSLGGLGEGRRIELVMKSVHSGKEERLVLDAESVRLTGGFRRDVDLSRQMGKGEFASLFNGIVAYGKLAEYPDRPDKVLTSHITLFGVTPEGAPVEHRFKVDYAGDALKVYAGIQKYRHELMAGENRAK